VTPRPDIEIDAEATAGVIWFRSRPRMRTVGDGGSRRERLPEPVEPGRAYRAIGIKAWLRGWIERGRPDR
jgi:hypothetical protein